ncbi:uncharacterized protein LOC100377077 [Saccoglossus kowalevskii]|uniref:Trichohyalin-like n=1 Tax=Saccoglossus kowalevskii TaxID=10224 RepID=A0ABM0GR02_SACKO|nr:PREDICTED: trichohyalin-like [Saccoglossus kowalevskii]
MSAFNASDSRSNLRHQLLARPVSAANGQDNDEAAKEYAAFLREQERKIGPNGFLDSHKYTYSYQLKGKVVDSKGNKSSDTTVANGTGSHSAPPSARGKEIASVVNLQAKIEKDKKDFEKRMKIIEDHMWQHKQEERELKRSEGDIIKSRQHLRRTLRDYESAINRKRVSEEKKLTGTTKEEYEIQREITHRKENNTKSRIEKAQSKLQQNKDEGRKAEVLTGDLQRKYRRTATEIELRRTEVQRLNDEFTQKMKQKEEETFRLKKELAELALALNMETIKARTTQEDSKKDEKKDSIEKVKEANEMETSLDRRLRQNQGKASNHIMNTRKLSADLTLSKSRIALKGREEGRHMQDTHNRLVENTNTQRQLQEAAVNADLDLKSRQIDQRVQAHDIKRQANITHLTKHRKQQHEQELDAYLERLTKRQHEAARLEHEDKLKHCLRYVNKHEEVEQELYNKVRQAEYSRKQKEQTCKRLHNKLQEMKRNNSITMKEHAVECLRKEKELDQKLQREQADLYKYHVNREESYIMLQHHRAKMKEDKYLLEETEREHRRLLRIGEKSETAQSYS